MESKAWEYVEYLNFKMDCAREQHQLMWRLDYDKASQHFEELTRMKGEKVVELAQVMPPVPQYRKVTKPKVTHKKDGTLSTHGDRWFRLLRDNNKKPYFDGELKILQGYDDPNPGSDKQIKDWLFSLGWKPRTFKFIREGRGERKIPQVRNRGELCDSVVDLIGDNPAVAVLDGLTVIQHRLGIFKGFLESAIKIGDRYFLRAEVGGLTNTLRFKHRKPLVNLPGVDAPWGKEIRGCLIAGDEDHILCGADMSSLESTTKRHYMFFYDQDYVAEMSQPGFDEHLNLAKYAGVITKEQEEEYDSKNPDPEVNAIRKRFKVVNYSAIYGIQPPKLSREMGISREEAAKLLDAYWKRNWSINRIVDGLKVRVMGEEMWLLNPVSGFYYSLRFEKDKFSTLNQGTGCFCFDNWVKECRNLGEKFVGQFHDEHINNILIGEEKKVEEIYAEALEIVNKRLMLNVPLGMEAKFGKTYAEVH